MKQTPHTAERWLHVLPHLDPVYGGLSAVVPRLASQLSSQEHIPTRIAAFCSREEEHVANERKGSDISVWPLRRSEWMWNTALRERFHALIATAGGVHIHGVWESSTLMAACAARAAGVPYVLSAHGMLERWALANKRLKKQVYAALFEHRNTRRAACLHALTGAEAQDYRRFGCAGPVAVIPNGVEAPPSATQELFLARHPEAEGKRIILFLGRIHYKKGVDLLLHAWAEMAAQNTDAVLVLAGPDSEDTLPGALRTVEVLNLQERVLFTGMLDVRMKWSALAAASFFVLPSYSEGLSVAALEALSMGVPVILSQQCNLPEAAQAGAGWEVETAIPSLAAALDKALRCDAAAYRTCSTNAKLLAQREFSWESVTERMAALYRWVQGGEVPRNVDLLRGAA